MGTCTPSFDGEVVFVTGASGGMGRAITRAFAAAGASVVAADVDDEGGKETVSQAAAAGVVRSIPTSNSNARSRGWPSRLSSSRSTRSRASIMQSCALPDPQSMSAGAPGMNTAAWDRAESTSSRRPLRERTAPVSAMLTW